MGKITEFRKYIIYFVGIVLAFKNAEFVWGWDIRHNITRAAVNLLPKQDREMLGSAVVESLIDSYYLNPVQNRTNEFSCIDVLL